MIKPNKPKTIQTRIDHVRLQGDTIFGLLWYGNLLNSSISFNSHFLLYQGAKSYNVHVMY